MHSIAMHQSILTFARRSKRDNRKYEKERQDQRSGSLMIVWRTRLVDLEERRGLGLY